MEKNKYLLMIPVLAAVLLLFPAAKPANAGGSVSVGLSFGIPLYDAYPTYYYPTYYYPSYSYPYRYGGWWDDRPYWRGRYWDRHDHRFFTHRHPRHDRHFDRHHDFDRRDHGRHRGYDRW